ncbi:hypothetical protein APHAL10511_007003 [Amanita phalloides]|nr:hypothetical protein APHAL10511_007003 [Amanita phalloides]
MSSVFTPTNVVDLSKEKEWAANLGMLDWDSTCIIFSKRSLIEFLKYTGTTVDTNFNNISKLPRYAKFGMLTSLPEPGGTEVTSPESKAIGAKDQSYELGHASVSGDDATSKTNRRDQTIAGGPIYDIFGHDEGEDALSMAPSKSGGPIREVDGFGEKEARVETLETETNTSSNFKPSRRVRTQPGGQSTLGNLWKSDQPIEEQKPSRRVREGPGGQDHLNNLFWS